MSTDDEKDKMTKLPHQLPDDDESGGGKSGSIEFRDFIGGAGSLRDDTLPIDEQKRLLTIHNGEHESRVKKQKALRDQRKDLKDGKIPLQDYRQGMQSGMSSQYPPHPALSDKAQFSGVDRQINAVPTENAAQTNDANRNELEHQYNLRHRPEAAPRFNPKPQFR